MAHRELTAIEMQTLQSALKYGFTFYGDSHFKSCKTAIRVLHSLDKRGILQKTEHEGYGPYFRPTQLGRDIIKYGSVEAALA